MSVSPPPTYDAHYTTTTGLKPYLELPYLYSLTWLAYPILSLIFVAFRLHASLDSAQDAIDSAKSNLLASCKAAETAATSAASMPRYMAIVMNQQYSDAVNASLNAARATLVVSLTIMEAIINFIVDIYRSTLLCFLELVIRGGLAVLIAGVAELNKVITAAASGIESAIEGSISTANDAIKSAIDAINAVNPFSDINVPTISTPDLSSLSNVTLPDSFTQALTSLNDSLPTFQDLKDKVEEVIDTPFELLKGEINDTFSGMVLSPAGLPVPEQNTLAFCGDMDLSVVDDVGRDLIKLTKISIVVIILVALILIGLNCLLEWYKWRCQERHFQYTREAWMTDPSVYHSKDTVGAPQVSLTDHNLLMLHATAAHPLLTRFSNWISARLRLSPSKHNNLQWFFQYVFHPPALACFLIGFFGLMAIEIQLLAMRPLVDSYSDKVAATEAGFTNTIATSINSSMYNQSAAYALSVNTQVDGMQSSINDGLFGWVNTTTTTLNDTIVEFYDEIQSAVSSVFNGTILEDAAQEFIRCLIGSKVDAIENALTFLHDNLSIDLPRVNESVLVLSQSQVDEVSQPIAAATVGGSNDDDDGGILGSLVSSYVKSLEKERITFGVFLALWGFVVIMAICIILWHSYGKGFLEKRRRRKWQREQRGGETGFVDPFRTGQPMYPPSQDSFSVVDHRNTAPQSPKRGFSLPFFKRPRIPLPSELKNEKSWDSFFVEKPTTQPPPEERKRTISHPRRLMALGNMGRERFDSGAEPDLHGSDPSIEAQESQKSSTTWLGRITALLNRKQDTADETGTIESGSSRQRFRPNLRISVGRAEASKPSYVLAPAPVAPPPVPAMRTDTVRALSSRWSASPVEPPAAPWAKKVLSPTAYKWMPQKSKVPETDVPAEVQSDAYEEPLPVPSTLAPPLHYGFDNRDSVNARGLFATPFVAGASHHRSFSDSAWLKNDPASAHKSTTVNPFVTPFDDEHQVTIKHADARKSIPTNPFTGGVAF